MKEYEITSPGRIEPSCADCYEAEIVRLDYSPRIVVLCERHDLQRLANLCERHRGQHLPPATTARCAECEPNHFPGTEGTHFAGLPLEHPPLRSLSEVEAERVENAAQNPIPGGHGSKVSTLSVGTARTRINDTFDNLEEIVSAHTLNEFDTVCDDLVSLSMNLRKRLRHQG